MKHGAWIFVVALGCSSSSVTPTGNDAAVTDVQTVTDTPSGTDTPAVTPDRPATYTEMPFLTENPVRRFDGAPGDMLTPGHDYRAVIETDAGRMVLDLLEAETPVTVNSFVFLARNHFYEGIAFHRVIEGFMAQSGDPNTIGTNRASWGTGGPGYNFSLEVQDGLGFDGPGVLGMARATSPDTNGSQFFITFAAQPRLSGMYTVFGRVIEGMSVLATVARGEPPMTPTRITRVTILDGVR